MDWFDKAEDELTNALNDGIISQKEFDHEMRLLQDEWRSGAEQAASEAYDNYSG